MRILDLGCGSGSDLASWGISATDKVIGLDMNFQHLSAAKTRFSQRSFLCGVGECLPFEDECFDRVISGVALPYMKIPKALAEIYRVLAPGGGLSLSLHSPSFTFDELRRHAFPKPIPTVFRLYVMANGVWFHCTGRTMGFIRGRTESFQTERGIGTAMRRCGFDAFAFKRTPGPAGERFHVEVVKPPVNPIPAVRIA